MFNKLQLHEQENSTNKKQQSIIVVGKYIHTCTNKKISFLLQRSQDVYFRQSMYI
jgi:hypothetical protein